MHLKLVGPLNTLNGIPLYTVLGPCAVHPNPVGPLNTLNGIPGYTDPGAVRPKPAGPV